MKILAIGSRFSGVSFHRLFMPISYLEKEYAMLTDQLNESELEKGYDIVLINRHIPNVDIEQLKEWHNKYGFKLIVDIDDYWILDQWHILKAYYPVQKIIDHIAAADVVTCTNQFLYDEIKQINRHVYILPNALPYGKDQFADHKSESDITKGMLRIIYAGGITHEKDMQLIKNPFKRIASDPYLKDKLHFTLCGYEPEQKQTHMVWHRMIDSFLCGFKLNGYIRAALPVDSYMNFYNEADISIAPLVDSKFNSMKSNLKVLEAATKKLCVITSNVHPYKDCPYAVKVGNQSDWFNQIKKVTKDSIYRQEMAEANQKWCFDNFHLDKINIERKQIYQSCL